MRGGLSTGQEFVQSSLETACGLAVVESADAAISAKRAGCRKQLRTKQQDKQLVCSNAKLTGNWDCGAREGGGVGGVSKSSISYQQCWDKCFLEVLV